MIRGCFRRQESAASLKHYEATAYWADWPTFPPAKVGGLIEACLLLFCSRQHDAFPPAKVGGLIEAGLPKISLAVVLRGVSAGKSRRPH